MRQRKYTQCARPAMWPISWAITRQQRLRISPGARPGASWQNGGPYRATLTTPTRHAADASPNAKFTMGCGNKSRAVIPITQKASAGLSA